MRRVSLAAIAAVVVLAVQIPGEARAQGFFQNLFGGFKPQQAYPQEPRRVLESPYGYRTPPSRPASRDRREEESQSQDGTGNYRTLCVRMCDGFYWPVSFATKRSGFYHDANVCRSSCGEEARLFFHASRDRDTKEMVDISGRNYTKLPTAYLYRKTQVEGCKCKPEPWSQTELDRHRIYALNEADNERRRREALAFEAQLAAEKAAQVAAEKAEKAAQLAAEQIAKAEAVASVKRLLAAKSKTHATPLPAAEVAAAAPIAGGTPEIVTHIKKAVRPGSAPGTPPGPALAPPPASDPAVTAMADAILPAAPLAGRRTENSNTENQGTENAGTEATPQGAEKSDPAPARRHAANLSPRAERRQAVANQGRPRVIQARVKPSSPSGAFGLGASSKSMRWPGE